MWFRTGVLVASLAMGLVVVPALMEGCIERPKVGPVGSDAADLPSAKETAGADGGAELPPGDSLPDAPDVPCADECGCAPECGVKECGGDGCGGSCGQCPVQHLCQEGQCVFSEDCGDDSCDGGEDCLSCPDDCKCGGGQKCDEGQCIECPEYCGKYGKQCGELQGCDCGTCGQQTTCIDGQCVCEPDCEGKECGSDSCGGSCGNCPSAQDQCLDGLCSCTPECELKECGDDGCGGNCGSCEGATCVGGSCVFSECNDGNDVDWDGCTNGQITEFQVNSNAGFSAGGSSVATFGDGGFVVAWESWGQDGDGRGVFARRFSSEGLAFGPEVQVNTAVIDDQQNATVASLAAGGFVVVWDSTGQDGSDRGIFGQRFNNGGSPSGPEFQVNSYTLEAQERCSVASLAAGGFVVVWKSYGQDGGGYGVFGQRFDSDGSTAGGEFQLNTTSDNYQINPSVARNGEQGFVAVWQSKHQETGENVDFGIFGQRFDIGGSKVGGEFQVNSYTEESQKYPSVSASSDGAYVVVWESDVQDGDDFGVFGQRFTAGGNKAGGEFPVNTWTINLQMDPEVASLSGGGFAVVWESWGQDDSDRAVMGQRFDSGGSKLGNEFLVNTCGSGYQMNADVAAFDGGGFIVVWDSGGQDECNEGVFAQRYDGNGDKKYQ